MLPYSPPVRPIAARMVGNEARYATEAAREHHPTVWDRTLVFLILAGIAALALSVALSWALLHFYYPR